MIKNFLATTGHGIARAEHVAAKQWSVELLLRDQDIRCLVADPLNPEIVYAGTQGNGILRSHDRGKTWHPCGLSGQVVKALAMSPAAPGVVYAGTKPACLFVSSDDGDTWTELMTFRLIPWRFLWLSPAEPPFIGYVQSIALSPTDPKTIVVGIESGAVVRSSDGGQTWTGHREGALRDCHTLTFHVSHGDWAYEAGGTGAGVSVSQTAGDSWTQPAENLRQHYGWAVAADPEQPALWYASVASSALKAHTDQQAGASVVRMVRGQPWQKLEGGLPQPLTSMPYALLTDPFAPGHVYTGLGNGEVWHSSDHGEGWRQLPFALGRIARALIALYI